MNKRILISLIWLWFGIAIFWGVENLYINMYFIDPNIIPREEQRVIYISLMVSLSAIANVFAIWLSGAASDACRSHIGRRKPYIILGGILGGIFLMLFPLVKYFETTLEKVIYAVIIDCSLSFCGDFTTGSRYALLTDLTKERERGKINGILNIVYMFGMATPLVLAEFVRINLGLDIFFYIAGILMILATTTSVIFIKEIPIKGDQKTFREYLRLSLSKINYEDNKSFYHALIGVAILSLGGNIFYPFLFVYIIDYLEIRGNLYTIMVASVLFMNLMFQIPIGIISDKYGRKFVYKILLPIDVLFLILFSLVGPGEFFFALFIGGIAITFYFTIKVIVVAWMQDLCPEDQRGSLLVYNNIADILPMVPGAIIGGLLADFFTAGTNELFHPIMFIAAGITIIFSIPIFLRIPDKLKIHK